MAVTNGIDLLTVGKILGYTNYQTTERYARLADEAVRRASDRGSGIMAGAIAPARSAPATRLREAAIVICLLITQQELFGPIGADVEQTLTIMATKYLKWSSMISARLCVVGVLKA